MIDQSESISLGACGLPYYVEGLFTDIGKLFETPIGVKRTPQFFKKVKGFDVVTKAQATKIDRENKTFQVKYLDLDKEEELSYDKLVLATGSHAFLPPPYSWG